MCLNSDIKLLRVEHTDVLHEVHKLDKINKDLAYENIKMKDILHVKNIDLKNKIDFSN